VFGVHLTSLNLLLTRPKVFYFQELAISVLSTSYVNFHFVLFHWHSRTFQSIYWQQSSFSHPCCTHIFRCHYIVSFHSVCHVFAFLSRQNFKTAVYRSYF